MSSRTRRSLVLESYLQTPDETASLYLLTSTLGCSVNWLISQFIGVALDETGNLAQQDGTVGETHQASAVVLVSWLRDLAFWNHELRRATGVDVGKFTQDNRFAFVDFLSQQIYDLADQTRLIAAAIAQLQQANPDRRVVLVLDSPDVLLATNSTSAQALNTSALNLRALAHATILSAAADLPLISAAAPSASIHAGQPTPLEAECASFVASQAHNARLVMSARELTTGAAKDISGVLRITRGGDTYETQTQMTTELREAELQYLVQKDGIVKVFSRGADVS